LIFLLSLVFLIIIYLEVPPLVKNKSWRELIAFAVFLWLGMFLSVPLVLGFDLPSPTKAIEAIFKPLANWLKPP
jgi:hypothetical protein